MGSNCVASTSIGCLFCCKGCNAEKVRNAFTFIPPQPSYAIQGDQQDPQTCKICYTLEGLNSSTLYRQAAAACEVHWVTTRKGNQIPLVWLLRSSANKASPRLNSGLNGSKDIHATEEPLVLLHCHGNATDIGMMMGPYYELAQVLGIEVVGVEYSGYGDASGKPSASNTCADVEAAYEYIVSLGVSPKRIVAYGQSVGSGPVASLAAKRELGGVIFHSPLLSGIKVVDPHPDSCCRPSCVWHCFDFYQNDRRVKTLSCPVFSMHGQRDEIIPFYHGYRLHKACPKAYRWPGYFPAQAGHNDIVETDMRRYFGEISNFLHDVRKLMRGISVGPPAAVKPQQVEMLLQKPWAAAVSGTAEASCTAKGSSGLGDFIGSAPEPKAGPEDGRYEQMRRGNVVAGTAAGSLGK